MLCGLQVVNGAAAVVNLMDEDLIFSWDASTTKAQKNAFTRAFTAAKKAGLQVSMKSERLSGFSMPVVLDIDVVHLLRDVTISGGHRNLQIFTLKYHPQFNLVLNLLYFMLNSSYTAAFLSIEICMTITLLFSKLNIFYLSPSKYVALNRGPRA